MKRKVRLSRRPPHGTREDCPLAWLWVRDRLGTYAKVRFCLDTGSDVSALPISLARLEQIPFPRDEAARGTAAGLVGSVDRYRGSLTVRIAGIDYTWPCEFLDTTGPLSADPYGVIGRAGFAFCLNKPYFTLRRRKFWTIFLPPWTLMHRVDEPL
jgi:hypothetical protein